MGSHFLSKEPSSFMFESLNLWFWHLFCTKDAIKISSLNDLILQWRLWWPNFFCFKLKGTESPQFIQLTYPHDQKQYLDRRQTKLVTNPAKITGERGRWILGDLPGCLSWLIDRIEAERLSWGLIRYNPVVAAAPARGWSSACICFGLLGNLCHWHQ